uniref:Uncharacterized protein n=1 Tax=Arundo donax TaxID=35708 RepID=A0A0A8Y281_ARUDO
MVRSGSSAPDINLPKVRVQFIIFQDFLALASPLSPPLPIQEVPCSNSRRLHSCS